MSRGIDAGSIRVAGSIGTPSAFASKNSPVGLTGFWATALQDQAAMAASPAHRRDDHTLIERSPVHMNAQHSRSAVRVAEMRPRADGAVQGPMRESAHSVTIPQS